MLGQLLTHAIGCGIGLVDLVDRHHQRYAGVARVMDGFHRLRHDAVVGRHHQHHDIGGLGAARAHGGKGLVTRGIEEGNNALRGFDMVGADVLGNAAGFAGGHLGLANVIEQRGLAVVDVAHHCHHRRPGFGLAINGAAGLQQILGTFGPAFLDRVAQLRHDNGGRVAVEHLIDGHHRAEFHQGLDDLGRLDGHLLGQFRHRDGLGQNHFMDDRRGGQGKAVLAGDAGYHR